MTSRSCILALAALALLVSGCDDDPASPASTKPVYVDGTNGAVDAAGTAADPLRHIQAGIDLAAADGREVRVAEGLYVFDGSAAASVVLAAGVDLRGGWVNADGVWTRDVDDHPTCLRDLSDEGGTETNPCRVLTCDYGTPGGDGVVLDGFTIEGGGGDLSAAILVGGRASLTIRDCIVSAGGATRSYGLLVDFLAAPSDARITVETSVFGGGGGDEVWGIRVRETDLTLRATVVAGLSADDETCGMEFGHGELLIEGCTLDGGAAALSGCALRLDEADRYTVAGSTLSGGTGADATCALQVTDTGESGEISGNTLDGGTGDLSIALQLDWGLVNPAVDDNLLRATGGERRYGVYETANLADPASLTGNVFHASLLAGATIGAYYHDHTDYVQTDLADLADVNALDEDGLNPEGSCEGNEVAGE